MKIEAFGKTITTRYIFTTRRFALYAVGLAVFAIGLVFAVIVPQVQTAWDTYAELQKQERAVAQLQSKLAQLDQFPQSELFAYADKINGVLPNRKPLLEFLGALHEVSEANSVIYSELSLSPGKVASSGADLTMPAGARSGTVANTANATNTRSRTGISGTDALSLHVKITGSLANINRFLIGIEQVAPFATVAQLKLIERTAVAQQAQLQFDSDGQPIDPDPLQQAQVTDFGSLFEAELQVDAYFFTQSIATTLTAPIPNLGAVQNNVFAQIDSYRYPTIAIDSVIQGGLADPFGVAGFEVYRD